MSVNIWSGEVDTTWAQVGNWSLGAIPVSSDEVIIPVGATQQVQGKALDDAKLKDFKVEKGCLADIGNVSSGVPVWLHLTVDEELTLSGAGVSYIDYAGSASTPDTVHVMHTGTLLANEKFNVNLRGRGTTLNVSQKSSGKVAVGMVPGDEAAHSTVNLDSGVLHFGDSCVCNTCNQSGGVLYSNSPFTALNNDKGTAYMEAGMCTTMNVTGTVVYNASGVTIGTAVIRGKLDMSKGTGTVTITNCSMYDGAEIYDPHARLVITNGIDLVGCGDEDVKLSLGKNYTLTKSAI